MAFYTIELRSRAMAANATPIEGSWYVGVDHEGNHGAVVQFVGGEFVCSAGVVDMTIYQYLQLSQRGQADRERAVSVALRWLETLLKSPAVDWDQNQRAAAEEALAAAKASI